jgi:hypothetical protein
MSDVPRDVFRVVYDSDGKPFVARRRLIAVNRSWHTYECKGGAIIKENGSHWSDTMMGAIYRESDFLMYQMTMPGIFDQRVTLEKMKSLLDEAAEVGKLAELVGHLGPS